MWSAEDISTLENVLQINIFILFEWKRYAFYFKVIIFHLYLECIIYVYNIMMLNKKKNLIYSCNDLVEIVDERKHNHVM